MISQINTVLVYTSDQDRLRDFYVDILGFEVREDGDMGGGKGRWLEVAPKGAQTAFVLFPADPGSQETPGHVPATLGSRDLGALHADLTAKGVEVSDITDEAWGSYLRFTDPDGNEFLVTQN